MSSVIQSTSDASSDSLGPTVRVFGGMGVGTSDAPVSIGGPRQCRLLALLAVRADSVVSLDWLTEYLWDDDERPAAPTQAIRTYVSRLRLSLPEALRGWIVTEGTGYRLAAPPASVEHVLFATLRAEARAARDRDDPAAAHAMLDEALSMWRGDPFVELEDLDWARAEIERLQLDRLEMLEERWESALALGRHTQITGELAAFTAEHGNRDRAVQQYSLALHRSGRTAEALRVIADHRRRLADESGLDPSGDMVELERALLADDPSLAIEKVGRPLRGYRLLEQAGTGAFSIVWRAMQPSVDREVAIKQIRSDLAVQPDFIRRFEAEAHLVARLEHPHVVPLIDYWRDPESAYLVMRWLQGGTLERRLDDGPLGLAETITMAHQIGGALAAAHARGIVHRDVKTANILYDDVGNAFLGDFGIALEATRSAGPEALLSPGSPVYASPEQIRRELLGPEADVFSLGVVLFECLAGSIPFPAVSSVEEMIEHQLERPAPSLVELRTDVPVWVSAAIATAMSKSPTDRFSSIAGFLAALDSGSTAAADGTNGGVGIASAIDGDVANPYLGLRAFDEADTDRFFGRERLVAQIVDRLVGDDIESRCVVVVGPSGSGKSSVVRAGVVPALRAGAVAGSADWFTTTMVPGDDPYESLEAALLRVAVNPPSSLRGQLRDGPRGILRSVRRCLGGDDDRLLLLVDQFEEVFVGRSAEDANAFLDALTVAVEDPTSPLRLVATLRADYYHRPLEHPAFAPVLTAASVDVQPLAADEVELAVVEPAARLGVRFEAGLVARIAAATVGQPSPLPLLQYTLSELFDRRAPSSDTLTVRAYDELGGLSGALSARAEAIHEAGGAGERSAIRRVVGRMTSPGEETADLRRRVALADLGADEDTRWVLDQFGAARLLTFDRDVASREPTVEVAHEALLREWPRLVGWLAADREVLREADAIAVAATAWDVGGRMDTDLYRGGRLEDASELATTDPDRLRPLDREFIEASRTAADADRQRERRQVRRLRRLVAGVAAALAIALVAGGIAFTQQQRADDEARAAEDAAAEAQRQAEIADEQADAAEDASAAAEAQKQVAQEQAEIARTAALVSRSAAVSADDPELSLLLALEARRRSPGWETDQAVLNSLAGTSIGSRSSTVELVPLTEACASQGAPAFISSDGLTRYWSSEDMMLSQNLVTGEVTEHGTPPTPCAGWFGDVDGNVRWAMGPQVITGTFETRRLDQFGRLDGPLVDVPGDLVGLVSRASAGTRFLFGVGVPGGGAGVVVVDAATGSIVGTPPEIRLDENSFPGSAASPDGRMLAIGGRAAPGAATDTDLEGRLFLIDAETGVVVFGAELPRRITSVAFDAEGGEIVAGDDGGSIITIDTATGTIVATTASSSTSALIALGVRPDGIVVAVSDALAELVDRRLGPVGEPVELDDAAFARVRPDGTVALFRSDEIVAVLDLGRAALVERAWEIDPAALVEFGAGRAAAVGESGAVEVVDLATGEREPLELVTSTGESFDAIAVYPEDDGVLAFADDAVAARWVDGAPAERVEMATIPGSVALTRPRSPQVEQVRGGGFAGQGAVLGFTRASGQSEEAYVLNTEPGELGVRLTVEQTFSDEISAYPARDGGVHLISEAGRFRTYDASGNRIGDEIELGMVGLTAVDGDTTTGTVALGGLAGAVIVDPAVGEFEVLAGVGPVVSLGFVRDGELLLVVGADGTVRLWDVDRNESVGVLWVGTGGASPSPPWYHEATDTVWVATSGKLLQFPLDPQRWAEKGCEIVGRILSQDEWDRFVADGGPAQSACP